MYKRKLLNRPLNKVQKNVSETDLQNIKNLYSTNQQMSDITLPNTNIFAFLLALLGITTSVDLSPKIKTVLDQGQQGTCLSNAVAAVVNYYFEQTKNLDTTKPENFISRFDMQFKNNLVGNGLNPNDLNDEILKEMVGSDDSFWNSLYKTGALFSYEFIGLSCGITDENIWAYPPVYVSEFKNLVNPYAKINPLIVKGYKHVDDKFYLDNISQYATNYGESNYTELTKLNGKNSNWYLSPDADAVGTSLYKQEVTPLIFTNQLDVILRQLGEAVFIYNSFTDNKPVLFGFSVAADFFNIDSSGLYLPAKQDFSIDDITGGHACSIVGMITSADLIQHYIDTGLESDVQYVIPNTWYFKVLNSWGADFGDKGFWYIDIDSFFTTTIENILSPLPHYVELMFSPVVYTLDKINLEQKKKRCKME
ncbi:MAG: hypothetical protein Terrestrivirus4_189 [Terrestrivirus sp.]|uniref:Uncharacterized protein n=1 Tax=Terrestrivirus sp. TaxID=2487775 RepID=A0A3G4ZQ84_9VIRU|nr:MAG: hypothetical protein Terrestrivirus4_189 [Terrestrivirus sp.]